MRSLKYNCLCSSYPPVSLQHTLQRHLKLHTCGWSTAFREPPDDVLRSQEHVQHFCTFGKGCIRTHPVQQSIHLPRFCLHQAGEQMPETKHIRYKSSWTQPTLLTSSADNLGHGATQCLRYHEDETRLLVTRGWYITHMWQPVAWCSYADGLWALENNPHCTSCAFPWRDALPWSDAHRLRESMAQGT